MGRTQKRVRDLAQGIPVAGFTGVNGAGKTLLAVESAIADMQLGRRVYSTVAIESAFGKSEPIRSLRQLLNLENCTVLLDEVSVIFSSRSSQSLPAEVVAFLQTLRHRGITVRWTAPGWMRCDNLLRQSTQAVVNVWPMLKRRTDSPWPRPLLSMAGVLDTTTGATDEVPTKVLRRRFVIPSKSVAWGSYDSLADTPLLGRHLQGGTCPDCGGTLERHKHSEARHRDLGLPWYGDDNRGPAVADGEGGQSIPGGIDTEGPGQGRSEAESVAALDAVPKVGTVRGAAERPVVTFTPRRNLRPVKGRK